MSIITSTSWTGSDWEQHVQLLLKIRYVERYQEVPAQHKGDLGIEGFSTDGNAYQCYAPGCYLPTKELYEKQRDKMAADLLKFWRNKTELCSLFENTIIERWVFVVPEHRSRLLVQYASTKAAEIRARGLPYVAPDFKVMIITDQHFTVERAKLATNGIAQLHIEAPSVEARQIDVWSTLNSSLLNTLQDKATRVPNLPRTNHEKFVREMLHRYMIAEAILAQLEEDYPDIYQQVIRCRDARAVLLVTQSMLAGNETSMGLQDQIKQLHDDLHRAVPGIGAKTINEITMGCIADWLLRCPLDFPRAA